MREARDLQRGHSRAAQTSRMRRLMFETSRMRRPMSQLLFAACRIQDSAVRGPLPRHGRFSGCCCCAGQCPPRSRRADARRNRHVGAYGRVRSLDSQTRELCTSSRASRRIRRRTVRARAYVSRRRGVLSIPLLRYRILNKRTFKHTYDAPRRAGARRALRATLTTNAGSESECFFRVYLCV